VDGLLVGFFYVILVVGETSSHDAAVDEVEWLAPCPVFLDVVYLEPAVWRNPAVGEPEMPRIKENTAIRTLLAELGTGPRR